MDDLEHLLLEAAGRTGTSGRKGPSHSQMRRRRETYADDGSDSGDDDSDSQGGPAKRTRPHIPPKKRLEPQDRDGRSGRGNDSMNEHEDDNRQDSYGSDSELSIGSDLYKDDEDRERLAKMSELERELILAERGSQRDDYRLKKKARASSKMDREETPPPPPRFGRSSVRSEKNAAKGDALNELRAKRLKLLDSEGTPRKLWDPSGGAGTISDRDSPIKSKRLHVAATPSDSSSSESDEKMHIRDHDFAGDNDSADSDEDGSASGIDPLTFDDVKAITIRRAKLAKWLMEPFFEEVIAGCFVRVGIGMSKSGQRIYRLCLVKNVDASEPDCTYKLENKTTHKYLNCIWGNDASAARWQMARVSDAPPIEEEFKALEREVDRAGGLMPDRSDILEKIEAIKKINNFVYSAATVKQMLQEKKSASSRPMNVAAEKNRLRKELEVAEARGDEAEMQRIQAKLKDLDMSRHAVKDSKALRLAEMNRKNRAENFKNASELKPINTSLKAGEAGYDPFSRRWTRSSNYYAQKSSGNGEANAANGSGEGNPGSSTAEGSANTLEAGKVATVAALEAAADAGKLVDTSAPVDLGTESNMLHNFEIPISLATLQNFGGPQGLFAGFMARKQKIEATIGCKVQENDGRRHALTLTVSDYKRRMGLL